MSLVFVHGIGNRPGQTYTADVAMRNALFESFLIPDLHPSSPADRIFNPLWGEHGARLYWDGRSFQDAEREVFGAREAAGAAALVPGDDPNQALTRVVRADLEEGIDLLFSLVDLRGRDATQAAELAALAVALVNYRDAGEFDWVAGIRDDLDLIDKLAREVAPPAPPGSERFGPGRVWPAAREVLAAAVQRLRREMVVRPMRNAATALHRVAAGPVSFLLGDVLTYFDTRGTREAPSPLVGVVIDDLERAAAAPPLVVVGHSMGAAVAYDILTHFRTDIEVDLLVTVGSQVGLFEELKLFRASDRSFSGTGGRVPAPPNVRKWINVLDTTDPLAYRAQGIFDGVEDLHHDAKVVRAHGAYFKQPYFHARLAAQVRKALS